MSEQNQGIKPADYKETMKTFSDVYAEETIRNASASNGKTDRLSEILMQISFAIAGLASTRIVGHFDAFPFTLVAISFAAFSIIAGGIQLYAEHKFFTAEMAISRELASLALVAWMTPSKESHDKFAEKFSEKRKESSGSVFLSFQVVFLAISVILIFFELNKTVV